MAGEIEALLREFSGEIKALRTLISTLTDRLTSHETVDREIHETVIQDRVNHAQKFAVIEAGLSELIKARDAEHVQENTLALVKAALGRNSNNGNGNHSVPSLPKSSFFKAIDSEIGKGIAHGLGILILFALGWLAHHLTIK